MIRYWIKLLSSNNDYIPKLDLLYAKTDVDNTMTYNDLNWAFQIKHLLESIGLSNIRIHQITIVDKATYFYTYKQSYYPAVYRYSRLEMYARY